MMPSIKFVFSFQMIHASWAIFTDPLHDAWSKLMRSFITWIPTSIDECPLTQNDAFNQFCVFFPDDLCIMSYLHWSTPWCKIKVIVIIHHMNFLIHWRMTSNTKIMPLLPKQSRLWFVWSINPVAHRFPQVSPGSRKASTIEIHQSDLLSRLVATTLAYTFIHSPWIKWVKCDCLASAPPAYISQD